MKAAGFNYIKAQSVQQAIDLLNSTDEARLLAGGQSLMASLNMRLSRPELLIDINPLDELQGISEQKDKVRVGALTRHVDVQRSPLIQTRVPLVAEAINHVAHAAIRNRGTIGGNIAMADPASELPACCVALDAGITVRGPEGEREIAAQEFFIDLYETALENGEMITAVSFPVAGDHSVCGFREFVRRKGDFAGTGLAFSGSLAGGRLETANPVFFAVANTPVLARQTAAALQGVELTRDLIQKARDILVQELDVVGDVFASREMKLHLAGHFLGEVLEEIHDRI